MTKNKQIYSIHCKYEKVFRKICKNVLVQYNKTLPIEWEDIYYKFLYSVPKILDKYDQKVGVSKRTFLFLECQYFAYNECRRWSTNNHKVMNFRSQLTYENSVHLSDSQKEEISLDISSLEDLELVVYKLYFLQGKKVTQIQSKLNISPYKVRKIIKKIKQKLNVQLV